MLKASPQFFQPQFIDKLAIDKAGRSIVFQFLGSGQEFLANK